MDEKMAKALRTPFRREQLMSFTRTWTDKRTGEIRQHEVPAVNIGTVIARISSVDPHWSWRPFALDENGLPAYTCDKDGEPVGLWILLTIGGISMPGYGSYPRRNASIRDPGFTATLVSQAIKHAARFFGVGLELRAKGAYLEEEIEHEPEDNGVQVDEADYSEPPLEDEPPDLEEHVDAANGADREQSRLELDDDDDKTVNPAIKNLTRHVKAQLDRRPEIAPQLIRESESVLGAKPTELSHPIKLELANLMAANDFWTIYNAYVTEKAKRSQIKDLLEKRFKLSSLLELRRIEFDRARTDLVKIAAAATKRGR